MKPRASRTRGATPAGAPEDRRPRGGQRLAGLLLTTLLGGLLSGCAEQALPERRTSADECLLGLRMDRLKEALQRCDRVVAAFPQDPRPLNDRYLIHTLAGDDRSACRDIARAVDLSRRLPPSGLDSLLRQDLKVRTDACRGIVVAAGPEARPDGPGSTASPLQRPSPAIQQLPGQPRQ